MPYTDQVHYKSNHPKPITCCKQPTVISASRLDEIKARADAILVKHDQTSQRNTVAALNAQQQGEKAINRAKNWQNTDFSNEDIRIQRLLDHKKQIQDQMFQMADSYQKRLEEKHEEEVKKAQAKIEDNSEYSRYLKVARHAADCAQFENERKAKQQQISQQTHKEEQEYKSFLERAAAKEKQYKSKLLEKAAADAKECAAFNEKVHRDLIYDQKMGTAEKNQELQEAKYFHQEWMKDQERERQAEITKMHDMQAMYEDYLKRERAKKDQYHMEETMQHHEELATQAAKDEVANLTAQRQKEFAQRVRDNVAKAQESAQYVVQAAEKKKNDTIQSMMLAKVDGERKRQQQNEWRTHWQQVNQDALEVQQLQEAERDAMRVAEKMEDLAYGRRMIELVEDERDQQGEIANKKRQEKLQRGIQAKSEMEEALERKKREIAEEKAKDREDLQKAMRALQEEKQIPIIAASQETRAEYAQSYQQVIRFMNKTEKTVSWQGDQM